MIAFYVFDRWLGRLLAALVTVYQRTLSLDHGPLARFTRTPRCRFHPTCSAYGKTAFLRFGALRGSRLTMARMLRCHPWHPGGMDPVPSVEGSREP